MKNKTALVLGNNTRKSLSPLIFNYWFLKYAVRGKYNYKEVREDEFESTIKKILSKKNICGLNITIPFKEKIIPYLDCLDESSRKINAVNCVTIKEKKAYGSNTDWIGYSNALSEKTTEQERRDKSVVLIGYGGAAKAILYALLKFEYKTIHVFNRTYEKLNKLESARVKPHIISDIKNYINTSNLIINTTPTNILQDLNIPKNLPPNVLVSDVVYRPIETNFLKYFKNPKEKIYGISMLINQAAPCFEKWFGILPKDDQELLEILKKEMKK